VTQTRERPTTETLDRAPAPSGHRPMGRWIPWLLGAVLVVVGAVALLMAQRPVDDSFDRAEQIRFEQIYAGRVMADVSDEIAEGIRMAGLAPAEGDGT
jgi:hypothetical protein